MGKTTISLSEELADELYSRKGRGESYEEVIWRLLEEEEESDPGAEEAGTDTTSTSSEPAEPPEDAPLEAVVSNIADSVMAGSGSKLEERREALLAVVSYLQEHREAKPAEFQEEVYPGHQAGYQNGRSWWKNALYPGLSAAAEQIDELEPADTSGVWTYSGGE